jgi:uncharacterized Zn finger protein
VELLQGRFSKGVMERLCRQDTGLFPKPSEITFDCSCADFASMCKHVAAALYGIGARLDEKPELLFRLRAVNENDLVANLDTALPLSKKPLAAGKVLKEKDVAELFGLDMEGGEDLLEADVAALAQPKRVAKFKSSGSVASKGRKLKRESAKKTAITPEQDGPTRRVEQTGGWRG